jgi:hypothetical protein
MNIAPARNFTYLSATNETLNIISQKKWRWSFSRRECMGLTVGICLLIVLGAYLERRTALRRIPMTDLGVFAVASEAVWNGENPYAVTDWHGWHYQYPPALAILFLPLAEPVPQGLPVLQPGEQYTESNTPWGYEISGHPGYGHGSYYYGLHDQNRRFFWIVATWYALSVLFIFLSAHCLACVLEGCGLRSPLPDGNAERHRWWKLRLFPLLVCVGSLVRDLSRGQVDLLMLAVIAFGIYLAANKDCFKAGLCLSFPATVKLFPAFLLLYPFWRRQWWLAAGVMTGLVLSLIILPGIVLGPKRTIELYQVWVQVLVKPALGHGTDTSRLKELTGMTSTDNQSLLAGIHNWRYYFLPRNQRPQEAAPWERHVVYLVGAAMMAGVGFAAGIRRRDSGRELLVIAGLLMGLACIVSPVVHNYYYLLMLPLVVALLDEGLTQKPGRAIDWKLLLPVLVFMLTNFMAQLPGIGTSLRDLGAPLLSLIYLMWSGAMVLIKWKGKQNQAAA